MFKIIRKIFGVGVLIFLLLMLGTCYWQNCRPKDTGPAPPSVAKAQFSVKIIVTGEIIFSNDVHTVVSEEGGKSVMINGYYENVKGEFTFKEVRLTLSEHDFGPLEVTKR